MTLTIMMFAMPMEPTISEMAAMPPMNAVSWSMTFVIWSTASSIVWTRISVPSCFSAVASASVSKYSVACVLISSTTAASSAPIISEL
ncbi:hypothetical protein [Halovenus salina]|uniref:Secreted protein n=1 Tax=Halovenus salina TaxID=1510225 RepID=A0ABD5VW89_9EURY